MPCLRNSSKTIHFWSSELLQDCSFLLFELLRDCPFLLVFGTYPKPSFPSLRNFSGELLYFLIFLASKKLKCVGYFFDAVCNWRIDCTLDWLFFVALLFYWGRLFSCLWSCLKTNKRKCASCLQIFSSCSLNMIRNYSIPSISSGWEHGHTSYSSLSGL